jgi:precorrin-6B methylase 2
VLLDVLADAGLIECDALGYRGHPDLAALATLMDERLAGLQVALSRERVGDRSTRDVYPQVVRPLADLVAAAADRASTLLATPGTHVLDLGAGAAPWSLAVLRREPTATLTAVERPEVVPVTRAAIDELGFASRATVVAADLTAADLPGPADIVLLAHVCHLFDEDGVRTVVERAASRVAPGGRLAIIEVVDAPARRELHAALRRYELGLFSRTDAGRVHSLKYLGAICSRAGLAQPTVHQLGLEPPQALLIAERTMT